MPNGFSFVDAKVGGVNSLTDSEVVQANGLTELLSISMGDRIEAINAGFIDEAVVVPDASIAGFVWIDVNQDGRYESGEERIPNVVVELLNDAGSPVTQVTTDEDGEYIFMGLTGGIYSVRFSSVPGFVFTATEVLPGSRIDSEPDQLTGITKNYNLTQSQDLTGINAGYFTELPVEEEASISGVTWIDQDENGIFDSQEVGLSEVVVQLQDLDGNLLAQTLTDEAGVYSFFGLVGGSYVVGFQRVVDYSFTAANAAPGTETDSEVDPVSGVTIAYDLEEGENLRGINAGYILDAPVGSESASISGFVWFDANIDGLIDITETGLPNVKVYLRDQDSILITETVTDLDGLYDFSNLSAGQYILNFDLLDGFVFTTAKAAVGTETDSDARESDGFTRLYSLGVNQQLTGINAGFKIDTPVDEAQASIEGLTWLDENGNGLIGVSEVGIPNVRVFLRDQDSLLITETLTDSEGRYRFSGLEDGLYYLNFEEQEGRVFTVAKAAVGTIWDSDVRESDGFTRLYSLEVGQELIGINAGYISDSVESQKSSISGLVWFDEDEDGLVGTTEEGIAEVKVYLRDQDSLLITETMTDPFGGYIFTGLERGQYILNFDEIDGFVYTTAKAAVGTETDSDVRESDGFTRLYDLNIAHQLTGINGGYKLIDVTPEPEPGTDLINGIVWEDINGNGILDPQEQGTPNLRVRLLSEDDDILESSFTDADGRYTFENLASDNYKIDFFLPLDVELTEAGVGSDESIDSDLVSGLTTEVIALPGTEGQDVNAGYYFPVSITGQVWLDINSDGIQDDDEPGTNNFLINLFNDSGEFIDRSFTNFNSIGEQGHYGFNGLRPGIYYVQVQGQQGVSYSPAFQADSTLDSDITGDNGAGTTQNFNLLSGESAEDIDIGLILEPSTIGDLLWIDQNGNGVQDDGEQGLNDIVVELYNNEGIKVNETITGTIEGEDGRYLFVDMYPTEYYVQFILGDDYVVTGSDLGGVDSKDSDINNSNGFGSTSIFLLSPGEADLDIDGGVFLKSSIGNRVWHDRNLDGLQDDNEPGVRAVEVTLFRLLNGEEPTMIDQQTTNALGSYRFENLSDGDYFVVFTPDELWEFTSLSAGDSENDNNADATGVTEIVTIENNISRNDIDAGLVRPSNQIAGQVWNDENENGSFETEETLLEGMTIILMSEDDEQLDETVTGRAGRYVFDDLEDGTYYVKLVADADYEFTEKDFGLDDVNDSDFNAVGETEMLIFDNGETVQRHVDAGLIRIGKFNSSIYPNPATGSHLNLRSYKYPHETGSVGRLLIMDEQGALRQAQKIQIPESEGYYNRSINISSLPAGFYYIKMDQGRRSEQLKLIKID